MREILFKAKRKDWKKLPKEEWWIEGYYRRIPCMGLHEHYIMPQNPKNRVEQYEIDPDTLCQYTRLTDKNGKKIWENDIVELPDENVYFKCEWEKDTARFVLNGDRFTVDFDDYREYEVEVIGNIFDNAELLEE